MASNLQELAGLSSIRLADLNAARCPKKIFRMPCYLSNDVADAVSVKRISELKNQSHEDKVEIPEDRRRE
jgi:hypothetical protein